MQHWSGLHADCDPVCMFGSTWIVGLNDEMFQQQWHMKYSCLELQITKFKNPKAVFLKSTSEVMSYSQTGNFMIYNS